MRKLVTYNVYAGLVDLVYSDGFHLIIYLNKDSGKVYYRSKINTISDVKHHGIYLGRDASGINYFMHNHYLDGKPTIVTEIGFSKGMNIFQSIGYSANPPLTIVKNALESIVRGESYDSVKYNCQSFTSEATNNVRYSPDVEKWKGLAFLGVLAIAVVAISKS